MKAIKSCFSFLICFSLLLTYIPCTSLATSQGEILLSRETIINAPTIKDSQIDQLNSVNSFKNFQSMTGNQTDELVIRGMVTSLLTGKIQVENSYMDVPLEEMLTTQFSASEAQNDLFQESIPLIDSISNENLVFFVQKAHLFGDMRKNAGIIITDEELNYDFSPISYSGNRATVDVTEYYSFQINTIGVRSYVNTEYHIVLEKTDTDLWEIKEITSNDWFDDATNYKPFDVGQLLSRMDSSDTSDSNIESLATNSLSPTATSVESLDYTINAARVANYADTFWDSYNTSLYGNYNSRGGDCMNFASQCLAAGLGFSSDATSIAIGSAPCDNIGSYTWTPKSASFIGCESFRTYLSSNSSGGETGLVGTVETLTSKTHTYKAGDILHVDNGDDIPYSHAGIVTHAGDKSTARVSAHNNDRHDVTISWIWNTSSDIKLCSVTGYYTHSNCSGHAYSNTSNTGNGIDSTCNNCGYSRLRINAATFAPLSKGTTKTISANTSMNCYRIAIGVTTPSGQTTWLPFAMNTSSISESYTFAETGLYNITIAARDLNDSITGSISKTFTYQVRVG